MFSHKSARDQAIVTPLPPKAKKIDTDIIKKSSGNSESNDEAGRDDIPLLKPNTLTEEMPKVVEEEMIVVVLPSRSSSYRSMSCLWVHYNKTDMFVRQQDRFLLFFRCLMGSLGTTMAFYAMSNMPLTDAIVIIFTSPIFTFFLAAIVLGEAIDYVDFFGGITSFVGVLFVTRPAILFPSQDLESSPPMLAILCAVGSSISQAIIYISMRKMKNLDSVLVIHYFLMFGAFYSTFIVWALGVKFELPTDPRFLVSIVCCAFFSLMGQWFLTKGFQTVNAGIASVMRYFDVVFVMCLDALVLGESINFYSMIGAAIIISGASVIVMRQTALKK
ncbi:drug metabolite transporter superfamily [Plasmopara halstedii]|uniref:Drug metabolite transporter superfamily n=1 Tax=Plasmopara halstedii TaxID=4781 RepID=A0A0P1ABK4_PLAHL|nr:drug metabolite transporter superfamily [Plasmopara halstedii]CEG37826.1 drug metabolite transporter superfamily [Plasmopara halstedii]|eukprot:XP_024574195.1 drug metabolite transporter superfamily [Plasmopara halstedii]